MKHLKNCRRLAAALTALMMTLSCFYALADAETKPAARSETVAKLLEVPDFKFFEREDGIGGGTCPVYTAPSEDSLRLADGQAHCNTGHEIAVAFHDNDWLMVRYEIKDKKVRVGYIPPRYSKGLKANVGKAHFVSIPLKITESIEITDNPRDNSTPYGELPADTEITILAKYTYSGNWWYVETVLDGKLTRGFINRGTAALLADGTVYHGNEELGYPVASPENTEQIGMITVNGTGDDALIVRERPTRDSNMKARVYGGESFPAYGTEEASGGRIWYRIWVDGVWGWFSSHNATLTEE